MKFLVYYQESLVLLDKRLFLCSVPTNTDSSKTEFFFDVKAEGISYV